jgi:hypothetical protein
LVGFTEKTRSEPSIGVEHAGELLGLRPTDAMGDQEGADLNV